ncbi:MAG: hypothetical protein RMM17_06595 [Acidobacteriota bacterium]|nr:hypothetical protein [Blastocatellia bacterium]MDW8412332.1 hypothetical protein [Acidobacteriota bacterium]
MPQVISVEDASGALYEIDLWMLRYEWFEFLTQQQQKVLLARKRIKLGVRASSLLLHLSLDYSRVYRIDEYTLQGDSLYLVLSSTQEKEYALLVGLSKGWAHRSATELLREHCTGKFLTYSAHRGRIKAVVRQSERDLRAFFLADFSVKTHYRLLLAEAIEWYSRCVRRYSSLRFFSLILPESTVNKVSALVSLFKPLSCELVLEALSVDGIYPVKPFWQMELALNPPERSRYVDSFFWDFL